MARNQVAVGGEKETCDVHPAAASNKEGRGGMAEEDKHVGVEHTRVLPSSPISLPLEVEVQMQNSPLKGTLEAFLVAVLPLLVDDAEGAVFIWRPSVYPASTTNDL